MGYSDKTSNRQPLEKHEKWREIRLFLFLVVVLFPVLTVAVVGGYGLVVWLSHMLTGPPGPPA